MNYENKSKTRFTSIGIGTWALMPTNGIWPHGVIKREEATQILENAISNDKIQLIDAATSYGNGSVNKLICECRPELATTEPNKNRIISAKIGRSISNIQELVNDAKILKQHTDSVLSHGKFNSVAIHDGDLLDYNVVAKIINYFQILKEEGKICSWGISLANPESSLLDNLHIKPDYIQFNFNILDHRARNNGLIAKCHMLNIIPFSRTIFFGGILCSEPFTRKEIYATRKLPECKTTHIEKFIDELGSPSLDYMTELCLAFVNNNCTIPLVGIISNSQLSNILEILERQSLKVADNVLKLAELTSNRLESLQHRRPVR